MNQKELMEYVTRRDKALYYAEQNRKAMELVRLWLKWVVLPTAVIGLAYLAYLGILSLRATQ